jgi:SAM-dependent methyltransferase
MELIEYQAMQMQEQHLWWYRSLHDVLLDRLQSLSPVRQARLLDAGCGTGGFMRKARQAFPALELTGLEYHSDAIRYLHNLSGITIVNGSVNRMPFADNSFDIITLTDVLYHQNIQPALCLSECLRILKPQGHLLVHVPAYNWMQSAHDRQVHTRERYTASRCRQQLQAAGFKLRHVGYWNSLLFPLMALHRLTTGKLTAGSDVKPMTEWQNNLLYRVIHCEQFLQRHHIHLPFGGSVWAWAIKA